MKENEKKAAMKLVIQVYSVFGVIVTELSNQTKGASLTLNDYVLLTTTTILKKNAVSKFSK